MKKLFQLSVLASGLGFVVFCSGDVLAGGATASGSLCVPVNTGAFVYPMSGIASGSDDQYTSCPIPLDDQALTNTVSFRLRGYDASPNGGYSCAGYVYDNNGNQVAVTALTKTTTAAFVGATTFTSWTASVPGTNLNTNIYFIYCKIPGNYSTIYNVRVQ